MNWILTSEIIAGILGYVAVMLGFFYLHGRTVLDHRLDEFELVIGLFWPVALVLAVPTLTFIFVGSSIGKLAYWIRDIGYQQAEDKRHAARVQQEAQRRLNAREFYD
jgi:hypothetical protein